MTSAVQQLLISYGSEVAPPPPPPIGSDWWVSGYTFGPTNPQRHMHTGEQGLTGNALVIGSMSTGYTTTLRADSGLTYGTPRTFTTSGYTYAYGEQPVMTSDGTLYVGVRARDASKTRTCINKHSADGTLVWTRYVDVADITQSRPPCYTVNPAGDIYSFIQPDANVTYGLGLLMKLNSSGVYQWGRYSAMVPLNYNARSVKIDTSDHVYSCFTGNTFSGSPPVYKGVVLEKYDTAGTNVWANWYRINTNYPLNTYELNGNYGYAFDVNLTNEDVYVLASGRTTVSNETFLRLLKVNASGVLQWAKPVYFTFGVGTARIGDVVVVSDGIVAAINGDYTGYLCKFDFSGAVVAAVEVRVSDVGIAFDINLAHLVKDGNGNLVLSYYGTAYLIGPPYENVGFTAKFPDDLSKTGTWVVGGGVNLSMTTTIDILIGADDSANMTTGSLVTSSSASIVQDGTGMFTESSATLATSITDIP